MYSWSVNGVVGENTKAPENSRKPVADKRLSFIIVMLLFFVDSYMCIHRSQPIAITNSRFCASSRIF